MSVVYVKFTCLGCPIVLTYRSDPFETLVPRRAKKDLDRVNALLIMRRRNLKYFRLNSF